MRVFLIASAIFTLASCSSPGAPWTDDQAIVIREKLLKLWQESSSVINSFDEFQKSSPPSDFDYVYDPNRNLSVVDCTTPQEELCNTYWFTKRKSNIKFTAIKMVRLGFHDCFPYKDGTGGCDGCINFDENVADNMVLQHSVAVLEKLYLEKDFPSSAPKLNKSPKDLGISRADLWAFGALVALDELQERTRTYCANFEHQLNCGDWDMSCFSPFPESIKSIFKTGRTDCQPAAHATAKTKYLASKVENAPANYATGPMTADYFKKNFGLEPREGLALMGAHTVGGFSTFKAHADYAWVRELDSHRNEIFNNEYYITLTAKDKHVKDEYCVGKMDGSKAKVEWHIFSNLFEYYWNQGDDWQNKERKFLWHHEVTRAPNCAAEDEDKLGEGDIFWKIEDLTDDRSMQLVKKAKDAGFNTFWEYCCDAQAHGNFDTDCELTVQNRIRHLSSDVGWYFGFDFDKDGFPIGCDQFKAISKSWMSVGHKNNLWSYGNGFKGKGKMKKGEFIQPNDCPKQKMKDEHGQQMFETVEMYAESNEKWVEDFAKAWDKMSQNKNSGLVSGPSNFWSHRCCIEKGLVYGGENLKAMKNVGSVLDCQKACKDFNGCKWFTYNDSNKMCFLKSAKINGQISNTKNYGGPPACPQSANECNIYA